MSVKKILLTIFFCFGFFNCYNTFSWGFFGHKLINRMAVFTLPTPIIGFYKKHIEYVTEHADTLQSYGIVPWWINVMMIKLTAAFREENIDKVLKYSADIGHYIADSHVPLHTTENYNGQMTNQKGIHGFWESRVPELLSENYDYWLGKAQYVDNISDRAWKTVEQSFAAKDSVLNFEAQLTSQFGGDQKYALEQRNGVTVRTYSEAFTRAYDKKLNGMVERRMRLSIITVGSMWYTAWVNAGQPNLDRLESKELSDSIKKAQAAEEYLWKTGTKLEKVKGHED